MEQPYWFPIGVRTTLPGFEKHFSETIGRGLCAACGACVSACPSKALFMKRAEPDPELVGNCLPNCDICSRVCPGRYIPLTELEKLTFGRVKTAEEQMFGIYRTAYCGYAVDPEIRQAGVAGGMVSALLTYGLDSGELDCAIVAG